MNNSIATQRTIKWIEVQLNGLESEMEQLNHQLKSKKKEYDDFIAVLTKLQTEDSFNNTHTHTEADFFNESHPTDTQSEIVDSETKNEDHASFEDTVSRSEDNIDSSYYEDEVDNIEKSEEDNSSPKDWLRSEYKNHLMEDAVCEIVGQCQPANTTDVTVRLYEVQENDPNFERARKSANAILNNAKKAGKLKMIKRGIFVLNSYPDSFEATVIQNGHHKTYQAV